MKEKSELKRNLREEIGTRLAELRGILNISKNKMAGMIGIDRAAFQRYEKGQYFPEYSIIVKLSSIFGISLDWLLANKGPMYYKEKSVETGETINNKIIMREEYLGLLDNMEKYPVLRYEIFLQAQKFLESKDQQPNVSQTKKQEV